MLIAGSIALLLLKHLKPQGASAATFDAAVVGVRDEAGRTELADRLVVLHFAGRVVRALLVLARVLAGVADAGQVAGAALVLEADGD